MAHAAEFSRHSDDLAPRADWNKQLAHLPCHAHQGAADLLRSGERKFDQMGRAVSLYNGEPRGSPRAQTPSHAGPHEATAADESPPACQNWQHIRKTASGWRDSNPRPPAPKAGALTKLRYIPYL
jgi:hypothetical protein